MFKRFTRRSGNTIKKRQEEALGDDRDETRQEDVEGEVRRLLVTTTEELMRAMDGIDFIIPPERNPLVKRVEKAFSEKVRKWYDVGSLGHNHFMSWFEREARRVHIKQCVLADATFIAKQHLQEWYYDDGAIKRSEYDDLKLYLKELVAEYNHNM